MLVQTAGVLCRMLVDTQGKGGRRTLVYSRPQPTMLASSCNKHGTIYVILSDFDDRMTTQSMGLTVLLSEHF